MNLYVDSDLLKDWLCVVGWSTKEKQVQSGQRGHTNLHSEAWVAIVQPVSTCMQNHLKHHIDRSSLAKGYVMSSVIIIMVQSVSNRYS